MKKLVSTLFLALALGAVAFSQQGGGGGGQRRGGQRGGGVQVTRSGSYFAWVSRADVAADIKITDDQKTKIEAAGKARMDAMTAAGEDQDARRAAATKAGEDYNAALNGILTDDQKKRLLGIFVQTFKGASLENPDVQSALGLSSDQTGKIKDLASKEAEANRSIQGKVTDGSMDRQAATEARAKNAETLSNDLMGVLTDDQKTKFAGLAGDKFTPDASLGSMMGGGRGGRRGGGGGAGGGGGNGN